VAPSILSIQKYKMFIAKLHKSQTATILSITDESLIGKTLSEKNRVLDLNNGFYRGEKKTKEELLRMIKLANHINAVGKQTIGILKKEGLIEKILTIKGVPYAQIINI